MTEEVSQLSSIHGGRDSPMKLRLATAVLIFNLAVNASCFANNMQTETGLIDNRLRPCPSSPNCVCSEDNNKSAIKPVVFNMEPETAWTQAGESIRQIGGEINKRTDTYLHATFTSKIFGFVDDMELRMDMENKIIHLRSASRIGYFDFGVNRKRVDAFKKQFHNKS